MTATLSNQGRESQPGTSAPPQDADDAMRQIWSEWFTFYTDHFRGRGIAISMADQQAFFEIAQPIMRALSQPQGAGNDTREAVIEDLERIAEIIREETRLTADGIIHNSTDVAKKILAALDRSSTDTERARR